jgi:hypothetical protein
MEVSSACVGIAVRLRDRLPQYNRQTTETPPPKLRGLRLCSSVICPAQANQRVQGNVAGQLVLKRETPELVVAHACH